MDKIKTKEAMKELTMVLMYLSRFKEHDRLTNNNGFQAWKGFNFNILNHLENNEWIMQSKHSKKVYITEKGIETAKELMKKYNIEDWKSQ